MSNPRSLAAEEYLDRFGITAYMKDVTTLLLENRPPQPLAFIAKYFRTVTQGSSPLLRAYRYIQLASPHQSAFLDNLVSAYVALDARRGVSGVTGAELLRLLRLVCADCPIDVSRSLMLLLDRTESEHVSFDEFAAAVRAGIYYDDFFTRACNLFAACDPHGTGRVPKSLMLLAARHVGSDVDAAGIATAHKHERPREITELASSAGAAASAASAPPPPIAARAELHRLEREVQWEVARLATANKADLNGSGAGGESGSSPSRQARANANDEECMVTMSQYLLALVRTALQPNCVRSSSARACHFPCAR